MSNRKSTKPAFATSFAKTSDVKKAMAGKKGEIATILTLGLVLVGGIITLASSFLINNSSRNFTSNSRADDWTPDRLCCLVHSCYNGKQEVNVVGYTGINSSGQAGYTSCSSTGYSGDVRTCDTVTGLGDVVNGQTLSINCDGSDDGVSDGEDTQCEYSSINRCLNDCPGTSTDRCSKQGCLKGTYKCIQNNGGGGNSGNSENSGNGDSEINLDKACCFSKGGVVTQYASSNARKTYGMTTPCTKKAYTNENGKVAYGADDWFECPDGSGGKSWEEYQAEENSSNVVPIESEDVLDPCEKAGGTGCVVNTNCTKKITARTADKYCKEMGDAEYVCCDKNGGGGGRTGKLGELCLEKIIMKDGKKTSKKTYSCLGMNLECIPNDKNGTCKEAYVSPAGNECSSFLTFTCSDEATNYDIYKSKSQICIDNKNNDMYIKNCWGATEKDCSSTLDQAKNTAIQTSCPDEGASQAELDIIAVAGQTQDNIPCAINENIKYCQKCTSTKGSNCTSVEYYQQGCVTYIGNSRESLSSWCSGAETTITANYEIDVDATGQISFAKDNICNYGNGVNTHYDYIKVSILKDNKNVASDNISGRPLSFPLTDSITFKTNTGGTFTMVVSYLTEVNPNTLMGGCTPTYNIAASALSVNRTTENNINLSVDLGKINSN